MPPTTPHALLPLFQRFLATRRRGLAGLDALIVASGLSRPTLLFLPRVAEQPPTGASAAALRPGAPYATLDPHEPWLTEATAANALARDETGHYRLTMRGHETVAALEHAATSHLATLRPLPADELHALADHLATIAAGLDEAADSPHAHVIRARRLAAFATTAASAPLVRIERAISALALVRDDAHIAAWQTARFPPTLLAILTPLWRGDAETSAELQTLLAPLQGPDDIAAHLEELLEQGYIEWKRGLLQPTRAGYNVRETIESDTDDHYFRQWPPLTPADLAHLHDTLTRLLAALPAPPPPSPTK